MKNNMIKFAAVALGTASFALVGCSDFEEINRNPHVADGNTTEAWYALNKSIIHSQQNPDTAERLFVLNWASSARQDGESTSCAVGGYNDGWLSASYNHMSNAIKHATTCLTLIDLQTETGVSADKGAFLANLKSYARIWRAYCMSEFVDSFGPMPLDGFTGVNPTFSTVEAVYDFLYSELSASVASIDLNVGPYGTASDADPVYNYNAAKWKKFGISLWMRLAMRLSEAAPAKAKSEFESAVKAGAGILETGETFRVEERPGWDDLTGVMSRPWNWQNLSATVANLTTNLGGDVRGILADPGQSIYVEPNPASYEPYIKDASTYLGKRFETYCEMNTDNPTQSFFFDGLPSKLDPRALIYFALPGERANRKVNDVYTYYPEKNSEAVLVEYMYDKNADEKSEKTRIAASRTDSKYAWNGLTVAWGSDQLLAKNGLVNGASQSLGYGATYPALADEYRNSRNHRVFFGPWETYFLLAEAAVRGWNVGTTAETAYNAGIKASFDYHGIGTLYAEYIASESYNRVGTSVKFSHTAEPADVEMAYVDGLTGTEKTMVYNYPKAANTLYAKVAATPALNDQLTKIITQKFIANTPWLPLENWSDHRRLGLPFFEIPAATRLFNNLPEWTQTSYQGAQKPGYFSQRMRYPSSLNNADPNEYKHAVELLGGDDVSVTPLWWAIGGH